MLQCVWFDWFGYSTNTPGPFCPLLLAMGPFLGQEEEQRGQETEEEQRGWWMDEENVLMMRTARYLIVCDLLQLERSSVRVVS